MNRSREGVVGDNASMTTQEPTPRFTLVRLREGYERAQVEEFLDQVEAALQFDPPLMRAAEVEAKLFRTVRLRQGYDLAEVDDHLDHLAEQLRARQAGD